MDLYIITCFFLSVHMISADSCDETFDDSSHSFTSPNNGRTYDANIDCKYTINVDHGRLIILSWTYFKIDGKMPNCDEDYVEVFIGCGASRSSVSRFCSNNMGDLPHQIYSKDNCMEVQLNSDSTAYSGGFKASYRSYEYRDVPSYRSCSSYQRESSATGIIVSPNYPNGIKKLSSCKWELEQRNNKKVYKLNFMDVDLSSSSFCNYISSSTYVKVEEEKSVLSSNKLNYYYCSKTHPFSLTTKFYELDVKLKTSYDARGRGLVVGWVAYTDDSAVKAVKYVWIVGVIIAIIFLVCCIGCICRRRRNINKTVYQQTVAREPLVQPKPTYQPPPPQSYGAVSPPYQQGIPSQEPPPYPGPPGAGYPGYQPQPGYPPQQPPPYPPQGQPPYPPPGNAPYQQATYQQSGPTQPYPTYDASAPPMNEKPNQGYY